MREFRTPSSTYAQDALNDVNAPFLRIEHNWAGSHDAVGSVLVRCMRDVVATSHVPSGVRKASYTQIVMSSPTTGVHEHAGAWEPGSDVSVGVLTRGPRGGRGPFNRPAQVVVSSSQGANGVIGARRSGPRMTRSACASAPLPG